MAKTAAEIREDLDFLRSACEDILDVARNDPEGPRDLTEDEQARFDEGEAELTRLKDALEADDARRARIAEFAALEPRDKSVVAGTAPAVIDNTRKDDDHMDVAARAMMGDRDAQRSIKDSARHMLDDLFGNDADSRQAGELALRGDTARSEDTGQIAYEIVLRSTEAYRSAFGEYLYATQGGYAPQFTPEQRRAVDATRALVGGTPAQGGLQIPTHLDPVWVQPNRDFIGSMRTYATTEVLPAGTRQWNGVSSDNISISWIGEDVNPNTRTVPESDPTQTAIQIDTHTAAAHMKASIEYDQDVGGAANVNRYFADARAREESVIFVSGDGVNKPTGIVTALAAVASSVIPSAALGVVDKDDWKNVLYRQLPVGYLEQARWLMHPATADTVTDLESDTVLTDRGRLARDASLPANVLGVPLAFTGAMSFDVTNSGDNIAVVGRLATYKIIDKMGATLVFNNDERDASTNLPTGHIGWTLYYRQGGGLGQTLTGVHGVANSLRMLQVQ